MKMLSALAFCQHLRTPRTFSAALADASIFDRDDPDYLRDRSADPGRSSIQRARQRLDVVCMLLQRRRFHSAAVDGSIKACFSRWHSC